MSGTIQTFLVRAFLPMSYSICADTFMATP